MPVYDEEASLISTFLLGDALFGIEALDVQEVIPLCEITPVHHAPNYISGIINLRGQIVTIIHLTEKLGMAEEDDLPARHILIVAWRGEMIGLLVDQVADVVAVEQDSLSPAPANVSAAQQQFIKGVCQAGTRLVAVLDINRVLDEEKDEIKSAGGG
jgi:purine-binding chemotaxis protein CheW